MGEVIDFLAEKQRREEEEAERLLSASLYLVEMEDGSTFLLELSVPFVGEEDDPS